MNYLKQLPFYPSYQRPKKNYLEFNDDDILSVKQQKLIVKAKLKEYNVDTEARIYVGRSGKPKIYTYLLKLFYGNNNEVQPILGKLFRYVMIMEFSICDSKDFAKAFVLPTMKANMASTYNIDPNVICDCGNTFAERMFEWCWYYSPQFKQDLNSEYHSDVKKLFTNKQHDNQYLTENHYANDILAAGKAETFVEAAYLGQLQDNIEYLKERGIMAALRIHRFWRDVCHNPQYRYCRKRMWIAYND